MTRLLSILILCLFPAILVAQEARLPDCQLFFNLDTAESSTVFDNRQLGCSDWSVVTTNDGFGGLTVTFEEAPDSGDTPGAWVIYSGTTLDGANPLTSLTSDSFRGNGYRSYLRVTSSGLGGTGVIRGVFYGFRATDSAIGATANVVVTNTPLPAQGAETEAAAAAGAPLRVSGWDGTDSYTLKTDTTGKVLIQGGNSTAVVGEGSETEGAASTGSPLRVAGWDGADSYTLKTDASGQLILSPTTNVGISDHHLDAFSRLRVSNPMAAFDSTLQYGVPALLYDTILAGAGTVTDVLAESAARLTVTGASGDRAVLQSHLYIPYQSGRSQLVIMTGTLGTAEANQDKMLGLFDDDDGLYYLNQATGPSVCIRSSTTGSPVDTCAAQASWNVDTLDGSGVSGITLDLTKAQIFVMDFQWLGVGRVRMGFDIDGRIVTVHEFLNANAGLSKVYMRTATLPTRAEIINTGVSTGSTMDVICQTVTREASPGDLKGLKFTTDTGATLTSTTTREPLLCIRPALLFNTITNRVFVDIDTINMIAAGNELFYEIVYNGAVTAGAWASVGTGSSVEVNSTGTAITGGTKVASGYVPVGVGSATDVVARELINELGVGLDATGTVQDTFCIVGTSVSGASSNGVSLSWQEIY